MAANTHRERRPQTRAADPAELRRTAAEWLLAVRARVQSLWEEVEAVRSAARDQDSPLRAVLPFDRLNDLASELEQADSAATMLTLVDDGAAMPDLLGALKRATGE